MTTQKVFDALLVLQYRTGNEKAFGLLVKRHHEKMCRQAYWYTHDREVAKDLVQDSWVIIAKKIDGLRDTHAFESWAMRIVTRKALNYLKGNRRKRNEPKEIKVLDAYETISEPSELLLQQLRTAIKSLPDNHQIVLRLFYTEQYTLKEIAEILNVSMGTVKSRLFHAREKLKTIIKK